MFHEGIRVLAGHADLSTTQEYIELSETQGTLVEKIWGEWREPAERPSSPPKAAPPRPVPLSSGGKLSSRPRHNTSRSAVGNKEAELGAATGALSSIRSRFWLAEAGQCLESGDKKPPAHALPSDDALSNLRRRLQFDGPEQPSPEDPDGKGKNSRGRRRALRQRPLIGPPRDGQQLAAPKGYVPGEPGPRLIERPPVPSPTARRIPAQTRHESGARSDDEAKGCVVIKRLRIRGKWVTLKFEV